MTDVRIFGFAAAPPAPNISETVRFEVETSLDNGQTWAILNPGVDDQVGPAATEHTVANVPDGPQRRFRVWAVDADDEREETPLEVVGDVNAKLPDSGAGPLQMESL